MASQTFGDKRRIRQHLQEINFEPERSAYEIVIELQVDDIRTHKLPPIKKGQALSWTNLSLPCDVSEDSTITLQITEIHPLKITNPVEKATYNILQVLNMDGVSIGCKNRVFKVLMRFMGEVEAKQAYSEAFEKVQRMENRPGLLERAGRIGHAFKALLDLGGIMADLDPTGGANVVFSVCTKAWEHLEQQEKQDVELGELVGSLARMIPSITAIKSLADDNLKETLTDMLNLIEDVSLFILNYRPRSSFERAWRSAINSEAQEQSQAYVTRLKELRSEFDTRVNVQALRAGEIERMNAKLRELNPADLAGCDLTRQCIAGTRLSIIDDLTTWAHTSDAGPRFAWINGPAGFGKSSIVTSVCVRLGRHNALASSFFCRRDTAELRDPRRVLTTVVHGLALRWEAYREAVVRVTGEDSELLLKHIQPLYDSLVSKPLQSLDRAKQPTNSLVVVVDALDECGDTKTRKQLLACLRNMAQLRPWLKVIVTSRPDLDIREYFEDEGAGHDWFTSFDVVGYNASTDIEVFVQDQLSGKARVQNWPNDAVDQVARRANGLFIWARTACTFILDGLDQLGRLKLVLDGAQLADIDSLYETTIKAGMLDAAGDNRACMLQCLGAIVVTATRAPLSINDLTLVLNNRVSQQVLERVVKSLSSVLYVDQKLGGAIRISHPSFMDYITNRSRSQGLHVNLNEHNTILAECCLKIMTKTLKFNICGLETSDRFNRDVPDLDKRVQDVIPPHLNYSCLYWSSHVTEAHMDSLGGCLRDFVLKQGLLYWIEALSLLGKLNAAPTSLLELIKCRIPDHMQDCRTAAYDAYRFVLWSYDATSRSTPHLYVSALALAPSNSEIAQRMRRYFPKLLSVEQAPEREWIPYLRSIWVSSEVQSVAYSPGGHRIISGSADGTVRMWDAETGDAVLEPLNVHSSEVNCVTFSPDGRWIASGSSDATIRVCDAETGESKDDPLRGHSESVLSVAFSADGRHIASGSADGTIRVWNWRTGECMLELRGHSDWVRSVAFSPDGQWIVSGSFDQTLRIWDAQTGEPSLQPLDGHSDYVRSVAFSSDGKRIVSGSGDKTVRIWDAKTGNALLEPLLGHLAWVRSVAFSPDCRLVASSSNDETVRIWDVQVGAAVSRPLDGHSDCVNSVAFCPDGHRVVSGSNDKTMRIWDIATADGTGSMQGPTTFNGHSGPIYSVAFSPNGRRIVSGGYDNMLRIRDVETGAMVLGPLDGHTDWVNSVGFSSDSRRVVSGSNDGTVRIWDAESGSPVLEPLRDRSNSVYSVAFSPDCRLVVSGSSGGTVHIWDAETGQAVHEPLEGHTYGVNCVTFAPDGRRIASGSRDNTIRIWDAETGQQVLEPLVGHSGRVHSVAFSSDGSRIVSGSDDGTLCIWDAENGYPVLGPLQGHESSVNSVTFSSDGRWVASGSDDKTVRVWSAETGEAIHEPLRGHSYAITSVAFSADSRWIVSGSGDMTVRIWDAESYILSNTHTTKLFPGTKVQLLPLYAAGDKLLAHRSQLSRRTHPDLAGWVTSNEGKPVVWLPPEMRQIDDSLVCISHSRIRRAALIDLTKFVHGDSWSSIAKV